MDSSLSVHLQRTAATELAAKANCKQKGGAPKECYGSLLSSAKSVVDSALSEPESQTTDRHNGREL